MSQSPQSLTQMLDQSEVRLFAGRSNPALAGSIAENLNIRLEETHVSRFSNDNLFVQLVASVRGRVVYIVQSLVPPVSDHLVELLMMLDIAKSAVSSDQPVDVKLLNGTLNANRLRIVDSGDVVRFEGGVVMNLVLDAPVLPTGPDESGTPPAQGAAR